jgi:hypothetical protein
MTKRDRHQEKSNLNTADIRNRSPKDILLLLITGIVFSFASMFWRTFGFYGLSIFCVPSLIQLVVELNQRKHRK